MAGGFPRPVKGSTVSQLTLHLPTLLSRIEAAARESGTGGACMRLTGFNYAGCDGIYTTSSAGAAVFAVSWSRSHGPSANGRGLGRRTLRGAAIRP